ncbi:restriction endonuclease [Patescibacteria group bacterium]|nr:restriction endonuclease [Patescibacteria group bacterium]
MSYYDQIKTELERIMEELQSYEKVFEHLKNEEQKLEKAKEAINQLAKERQIGFPWLAKAYDDFFELQDKQMVDFLKYKKQPAISASDIVKEYSRLRREAEKDKRQAQYLVEYYESIAPFLIDLKEEVDIGTDEDIKIFEDWEDEEREDEVTNFLTKEEYRKLPSAKRNQMALDRFWKRRKSKWLIGRLYERYVGYLFEKDGYNVDYVGIFKGFEDLGRDLICRKGKELVVIQCKNWSQFKTIYEKHIFQFFGTVFQYKDENPSFNIKAIFYTTTSLSDLARRFAKELGILLEENHKFDQGYPSIKCNIGRESNEKIYHMPFDQQYDKTKIEPKRGEFYCTTVKEAEDAGFRRAFRYSGKKHK